MRKQQHKSIMFQILQILFDSEYAKILWLKWWTALYFFYWLPRFSVDLDFDILKDLTKDEITDLKQWIFELLKNNLWKKWIKIKPEWTLAYSFKFIVQYWGEKKLKLEFNTKMYENSYNIKSLLWTSVQIMDISYMFAHKLCAFLSRYQQKNSIANRDLFDIKFLMENNFPINEKIIKIRTKKMIWKDLDIKWYIKYLLNFIDKHKKEIQNNILYWIWELIDDTQKNYMKNRFLDDLIREFSLYCL